MNFNHNSKNMARIDHHPIMMKRGPKSKKVTDNNSVREVRIEQNQVAPIRQTASIFKQPVTVYKDHKSKVKSDLKTVNKEKPSQLFWAKRLGNLTPVQYSHLQQDVETNFKLPKKVEKVGPGISDKMLLASISTHLHLSKDPAYGQKDSAGTIQKNAAAFVNPHQPLMTSMTVNDEDILAAEERVRLARLKLAKAIKGLALAV